jgi:hypothetical protein
MWGVPVNGFQPDESSSGRTNRRGIDDKLHRCSGAARAYTERHHDSGRGGLFLRALDNLPTGQYSEPRRRPVASWLRKRSRSLWGASLGPCARVGQGRHPCLDRQLLQHSSVGDALRCRRGIRDRTPALMQTYTLRAAFAVMVTCVALCGCLDDQKDQIARCRIDGKLAFTASGREWKEDIASPAVKYLNLCMETAGYEWSWRGKFCQPTFDGSENSNPYCYRSKGAISSFITDIEIAKNGGFDDWPDEIWCRRMRSYTPEYCWEHGGWFRS